MVSLKQGGAFFASDDSDSVSLAWEAVVVVRMDNVDNVSIYMNKWNAICHV